MHGKLSKNSLAKLFFFSQRNFSSRASSGITIKIVPDISYANTKAFVPISYARYNQSEDEYKRYDRDLDIIFSSLAKKIENDELSSVDILLTGGLQEINWPKEKCDQIEEHILKTHQKSLGKLSNLFHWHQFIDSIIGREKFERYLLEVNNKSAVGSKWYELMCKTHENTSISKCLDKSLLYQRTEYALIASAANLYTHIPYFGKLSDAWSFLNIAFPGLKIPQFCKIQLIKEYSAISTEGISQTTLLAYSIIEQIISSPNFPKKEKIRLFELMENLKQSYVSEEMIKKEQPKDEIASSTLKIG